MSLSCGLECVLCLGCSRWAWKRLTYVGNYDSESWPPAAPEDFEPVPRMCRAVLAVYEEDLAHPRFLPNGVAGAAHCIDPSWVVKHVNYDDIPDGLFPPYIIYADPVHRELVLAVRGLNLVREADYKVLMDNRLGREMFGGGYVHHGLLRAATALLNREADTLRRKLAELGPEYKLVFAGHSLGSGIVALMTIVVVKHLYKFGGIPRSQVRCYCIAPARCMSLNLAVKYADVIHSVILQDDFLPRTSTPLEYIFGSIFCLPCFLFLVCMRDTFIPEKKKLGDPRRLYAPGRMYHIVERKFCRCGRYPPEVKTAIPVDGRFEHIVLSCNATADHGIIWIEREAQKALKIMKERSEPTVPPQQQKMDRKQSLEKEHEDALVRAVCLNVPHAVEVTEVSHDATITEHLEQSSSKSSCATSNSQGATIAEHPGQSDSRPSCATASKSSGTNWDELIERLFTRTESRTFVVKKDLNIKD